MKNLFSLFLLIGQLGISGKIFANGNESNSSIDNDIAINIDSLTNINGNGALEACGTAVHKDGIKPVLITLKHGSSFYTTIAAANNNWCIVFKRWRYDGQIEVGASTLTKFGQAKTQVFNLSTISQN